MTPHDTLLQTPRLQLRRLTPSDVMSMLRTFGDTDTLRGWPRTYTLDGVLRMFRRIQGHYRSHGTGICAVILRKTGEHIGNCGMIPRTLGGWPVPELAYVFHRDHWGRGYATEAAAACRDDAFDRLGASRIIARITHGNHPSRRLAERLGMRPAGWWTWLDSIPHITYEMTTADRV